MGRLAGRLLMAIGIIHVGFFLWVGRGPMLAVVRDGFLNAVDPHRDRQMVFWSVCFGVMGFFLGQLISWCEGLGLPIPRVLGWEILGLAVLGAALMPVSGWWLVMIPGVLIVVNARRRLPTS